MTERFLAIFFACTTIGWAVYHFLMMRKMHRALETTKRMLNPQRDFKKDLSGHVHINGHGSFAVVGGGGGGGGSGSGGAGGSGQVSIKWPYGNPRIPTPTPTPSSGKVITRT